MADLRQAEEYGRFMESLGWVVEEGVFIKKLPIILCSFIKYQRPSWPVEFKKINKLAKKYRAIQIKIEPDVVHRARWDKIKKEMINNGYKSSRTPLLPTKTIWLDLRKSEKQLLKEMHHKTRYNIKKLQVTSYKLQVIQGSKVTNNLLRRFHEIYRKNARKQRFWGLRFNQLKSLIECFGNKCYLFCLHYPSNNALLGGLLILFHNKVAYYSHNAASEAGKKQFVPTWLTWEAIKLAKKLECVSFDFEGISDERFGVTRKWQGFSRFKKGFGGKEVEYVGCFSSLLF